MSKPLSERLLMQAAMAEDYDRTYGSRDAAYDAATLREAAARLKELEDAPVGMTWIPCSERLPELRDDAVIAYFAETDSPETVHIEDYFKPITAGVADDGAQKYSYWYISRGVTHWMPLPESPK